MGRAPRNSRDVNLVLHVHHLRWRSTIALIASFNAALRGDASKFIASAAKADTACRGKANCFGLGGFSRFCVTCTLSRIALTCHPRFSKFSCNFGNCCFSFAAIAAFGVDSTNCPESNCSTAQVSNMAGRVAAQSFCSAAMRVTVGRMAAILSCARRKSAAP